MPTTAEQIEIAKVCQYLAVRTIEVNGLYGGSIDPNLPRKLYCVRKNVEWLYDLDDEDETLVATGNLLYGLCNPFSFQAQAIINLNLGGNVVIPVSPTPLTASTLNFIEVRQGDFSTSTDYLDARLLGKTLSVFGNWLGGRYLEPVVEWDYVATGGVRILTTGFNSSAFGADDIIIRVDINGVIEDGVDASVYNYNLSNTTIITALPTGDEFQVRYVIVTPNGYDYSWGSSFVFTDNYPAQPLANGANTKQIYTFQYIAGLGNICIGQSLNVPI